MCLCLLRVTPVQGMWCLELGGPGGDVNQGSRLVLQVCARVQGLGQFLLSHPIFD